MIELNANCKQEIDVMQWLRTHDGITKAEAARELNVWNLPGVIHRLKTKRGFIIESKKEPNIHNKGYHARYYLP